MVDITQIITAFLGWLSAFWNLTIIPGTGITAGTLAVVLFLFLAVGIILKSVAGGAGSNRMSSGGGSEGE